MHVCMFQSEKRCPVAHRELIRSERASASGACCRSAGAEKQSKAREGGLSTTMFVHICCLLLEREVEPTRTCDLVRASGVVVLFVRRDDVVVGEAWRWLVEGCTVDQVAVVQ